MEERLLSELQVLLEACRQHGVEVFVIGGFGVRAYGSLLRRTLDLDMAVATRGWPALADVLKTQGYRLSSAGVWVAATKGEREDTVEIHIAVGDVVDVQSAGRYPVSIVIDGEVVGWAAGDPIKVYQSYWTRCQKAWLDCAERTRLKDQLASTMTSQAISSYPWSTKIMELCYMGAKTTGHIL